MSRSHSKKAGVNYKSLAEFTVQICSRDGRLLNEYGLTRKEHNVGTLAAAAQRAIVNLSDVRGEHLVVVVSEETLDDFRQVQLVVAPANDDVA